MHLRDAVLRRERVGFAAVASGYRSDRRLADVARGLDDGRRRDARRAENSDPERVHRAHCKVAVPAAATQVRAAPAGSEDGRWHSVPVLHERQLPGDGALELGGLVQGLREIGAVAPVGVEVFSDELHALDPLEAARRAGAALRRVLADY